MLWDELFFASRGCMRRISLTVAVCDAYAPVARLNCQTDHVVLLSRTQLSYAHARSTGSCANAREFSCDYSFDKRVNKTFLGVKILQSVDNLLLWSVTLTVARGGRSSTSSQGRAHSVLTRSGPVETRPRVRRRRKLRTTGQPCEVEDLSLIHISEPTRPY